MKKVLLAWSSGCTAFRFWQIPLPWPCTNDEYEVRMLEACRRAVAEGYGTIAFGDLYLADIRAYRERQLTGSGLRPVFPVWELPTAILARDMIRWRPARPPELHRFTPPRPGIRRPRVRPLPACRSSRLRRSLRRERQSHSFVYDGPMFHQPIPIKTGERHTNEHFIYTDILCPASSL